MLMHNKVNSRLAAKDHSTGLIGVKNIFYGIYRASITNNTVHYIIRDFISEQATMSVYNYIARAISGITMNGMEDELPIEEVLKLRMPGSEIFIPTGVGLPESIKDEKHIIRDNSKFKGAMQCSKYIFKAYYDNKDIIITIGYYITEVAAANAYNYYCMDHNYSDLNDLHPSQVIDRDALKTIETSSYEEAQAISTNRQLTTTENKFHISQILSNNNGDKFEIINVSSARDMNSYIRVMITIRFLETGYITTVTHKAIEMGAIKDHYKPYILGIGYIGEKYERNLITTKIHDWWYRMLKRATESNGTLITNPDWLNFTNFLADFPSLEGFNDFIG